MSRFNGGSHTLHLEWYAVYESSSTQGNHGKAALMFLRSSICILSAGLATTLLSPAQQRAVAVTPEKSVPVPNFRGKTLAEVRAAAVVPGSTKPLFLKTQAAGPEGGRVVSQWPAANTPVVPGRQQLSITLDHPTAATQTTQPGSTIKTTQVGSIINGILQQVVSGPKSRVTVPDLEGDARAAAARALTAVKLRAKFAGGDGTVVQQYPPAGQQVDPESIVTVTMDVPREIVPLLIGKNLGDAIRILGGVRLQATNLSDPVTDGTVTYQYPQAGTQVNLGSAVEVRLTAPIVVSPTPPPVITTPAVVPPTPLTLTTSATPTGGSTQTPTPTTSIVVSPPPPPPAEVFVPNLLKMTSEEAVNALVSVGLRQGEMKGPAHGLVTEEEPGAGTEQAAGTLVDLTLVEAPSPPRPGPPVWPLIVAVTGGTALITIATTKILARIRAPIHATCKVNARRVRTETTITRSPAVRFTVGVRDRVSEPRLLIGKEPVVTRKG